MTVYIVIDSWGDSIMEVFLSRQSADAYIETTLANDPSLATDGYYYIIVKEVKP